LSTDISGDIYRYARYAPLDAQTTAEFLGAAAIISLVGIFLVQRRMAERAAQGVVGVLSTRSLPYPQAERR
jgi:hypothetical protein